MSAYDFDDLPGSQHEGEEPPDFWETPLGQAGREISDLQCQVLALEQERNDLKDEVLALSQQLFDIEKLIGRALKAVGEETVKQYTNGVNGHVPKSTT